MDESLIHVEELHFFDNAPRQSANPRYFELQDSIERYGVDQPFVVSKRPDEKHFTLLGGGATRLQILKQLYQDSGDPKYSLARSIVREWPGELRATAMYLRADDLRGELTFIERAQSVVQLVDLRASELGKSKLSQRAAVRELSEIGYVVSQPLLGSMRYAVERLLPLIPRALEAGLGRKPIDEIRMIENTAREIWEQYADGDYPFAELFEEHCKRCDDERWDSDLLQMELEDEIAIGCGRDLHWVRMMFDRSKSGEEVNLVSETPPLIEPTGVRNTTSLAPSDEPTPSSAPQSEIEDGLTDQADDKPSRESSQPPSNPYLKQLRGYACTRALSLSKRIGIEDCVERAFGSHCGFFLVDVPEHIDDAKTRSVWELLAATSVMSDASSADWLQIVPVHARMRRKLDLAHSTITRALEGLRLDHIDPNLGLELSDDEWADVIGLMDVSRRIRMEMRRKGWPIWPKATQNDAISADNGELI